MNNANEKSSSNGKSTLFDRKNYRKRGGTDNSKGKNYEIELIAHFLVNAQTKYEDGKVDRFYLASNVDGFGDFDDVALHYEYTKNGDKKSKIILLQAKHSEVNQSLNYIELLQFYDTKDKKLNLRKSFESYMEIKRKGMLPDKGEEVDYIIFTSRSMLYEAMWERIELDYDDMLFIGPADEKLYCYKHRVIPNENVRLAVGEEVYEALKPTLRVTQLIHELAQCLTTTEEQRELDLGSNTMKYYKNALGKSAINLESGKFKDSFLNDVIHERFREELIKKLKENDQKFTQANKIKQKKCCFIGKSTSEIIDEFRKCEFKISNNKEGSKRKNSDDGPCELVYDENSDEDIKTFLSRLKFFHDQPDIWQLRNYTKQNIQNFYTVRGERLKAIFSRIQEWWEDKKKDSSKRMSMMVPFITETSAINDFNVKKSERQRKVFNLVKPVTHFIGRTDEKKKFSRQNVIISGLGGIGKTELVREYIRESSEHPQNKNRNIIWIDASNESTIQTMFITLARELGIYNIYNNITDIIAGTYYYFKDRRTIFIFDGADDENTKLDNFLPNKYFETCSFEVIITSRHRNWENVYILGGLRIDDAVDFFQKSLQGCNDAHEIRMLSEKLEGFPLAISQTIKYVNEKISIGYCLDNFEAVKKDLLETEIKDAGNNYYMDTTFSVFKKMIHKISIGFQFGTDILKIIAYLDSNNINKALLKEIIATENKSIDEIVDFLAECFVVSYQKQERNISQINQLFQAVIRILIESDSGKHERSLRRCLDLLLKKYSGVEESAKHVIAVWRHANKFKKLAELFGHNLCKFMQNLCGIGRFNEVHLIGNIVLPMLKRNGICSSKDYYINMEIELAKALTRCNKPFEAIQLCELIYEKTLKTRINLQQHLKQLENISDICHTNLACSKASEIIDAILEIKKENQVLDDIATKRRKGMVLFDKEDYEGAFKMFEPLSKISNDQELQHYLALIKYKQGSCTEALEELQRINPTEKSDIISYNIVSMLNHLTYYEQAQVNLLDILANLLSNDLRYNFTLKTMDALSLLLCNVSKFSEAHKVSEELLYRVKHSFGSNHRECLRQEENIGSILEMQGDYQGAIKQYFKVMTKEIRNFGSGSNILNVTQKMNNILHCYSSNIHSNPRNKIEIAQMAEVLDIASEENTCHIAKTQDKTIITTKSIKVVTPFAWSTNNQIYGEHGKVCISYPKGTPTGTELTLAYEAARLGDLDKVKELVRDMSGVTSRNIFGDTILHEAAKHGKATVVEYILSILLKASVQNVAIPGWCNLTPLHLAAQQGHEDVVELLLRHNPHFLSLDAYDTPLHRAVEGGNNKLMQKMLEYIIQERPHEIDAKDKAGNTALICAASCGNAYSIQILLKYGADRKQINNARKTPLHYAAENGDIYAANLLAKKREDIYVEKNSLTVLHSAVIGNNDLILRHILELFKENDYGTLYSLINAEDIDGDTPLIYSASIGNATATKTLLEYGADPLIKNVYGNTALHFAAENGHLEIADYLYDSRKYDGTILHKAVRSDCNERVLSFILEKYQLEDNEVQNHKINARDEFGNTPLICAAQYNSHMAVQLLIKYGADVNVKNYDGCDAVEVSIAKNHVAIYETLLNAPNLWEQNSGGIDL